MTQYKEYPTPTEPGWYVASSILAEDDPPMIVRVVRKWEQLWFWTAGSPDLFELEDVIWLSERIAIEDIVTKDLPKITGAFGYCDTKTHPGRWYPPVNMNKETK